MIACPIAFAQLVDAVSGELPGADEEALEEHVFACDRCGAAYAEVARLVGGLRSFVPPVITHAWLTRLRAGGARITLTPILPGGHATVHFGHDVDLLVHALHADLADVDHVEVVLESLEGEQLLALDDVPFDRVQGEILIACQRHYEALGMPNEIRFRVQAHTAAGPRTLGAYVVDHVFPG